MRIFSALTILLLSQSPVLAGDHLPLKSGVRVREVNSGREVLFAANRGFTYEIAPGAGGKSVLHIYDAAGLQFQGDFQISDTQLPEEMKKDLAAVMKASQGAEMKPGCCDVVPPKPEPKPALEAADTGVQELEPLHPVRQPAIEPGTHIVYADPLPPKKVSPPAPGGVCFSLRTFLAKGVPEAPLRQALAFYAQAKKKGTIQTGSHVIGISDYSQNSRKKRFYLLDLRTGSVTQEKVSHGSGKDHRGVDVGDHDNDGMLDRCGNVNNSNLTRAGFFRVGGYYFSNRGRFHWPLLTRHPARNGVRITPLSPGANDQSNGVVMHEAFYNHDGSVPMGRSFGCPAFVPGHGEALLEKLVEDESLLYSYAPQCGESMSHVTAQVPGWQNFCK